MSSSPLLVESKEKKNLAPKSKMEKEAKTVSIDTPGFSSTLTLSVDGSEISWTVENDSKSESVSTSDVSKNHTIYDTIRKSKIHREGKIGVEGYTHMYR
jgi:hypothetical protein